MKKYNVIVIFDKDFRKTLMCKRTKEPYKGMYNLVGGKIEKENDGLNEAYRELQEETNISREDISLIHFMNMEYIVFDKILVYELHTKKSLFGLFCNHLKAFLKLHYLNIERHYNPPIFPPRTTL